MGDVQTQGPEPGAPRGQGKPVRVPPPGRGRTPVEVVENRGKVGKAAVGGGPPVPGGELPAHRWLRKSPASEIEGVPTHRVDEEEVFGLREEGEAEVSRPEEVDLDGFAAGRAAGFALGPAA